MLYTIIAQYKGKESKYTLNSKIMIILKFIKRGDWAALGRSLGKLGLGAT